MDDRQSVLEVINEECSDDFDDVEMADVEEGEVSDCQIVHDKLGPNVSENINEEKTSPSLGRNKKRRKNKKKNKKKKVNPENVTDINRFVLDVCRRLKEKKSYLVYTAVGCLGISDFSDLMKEVDVIQVCGGQKTADGNRFRTGAYREIMKKGKEFEKQFRFSSGPRIQQANNKVHPESKPPSPISEDLTTEITPDKVISPMQNQNQPEVEELLEADNASRKSVSVHERIRVPVSYDDVLFGDEAK